MQLAAAASEFIENSRSNSSDENEASNDEHDHDGQVLDERTSQENHVVIPGAVGSQVVVAERGGRDTDPAVFTNGVTECLR